MKGLVIVAGTLMAIGSMSDMHARIDTFVNDSEFRVTGTVHYKGWIGGRSIACSHDKIDLGAGQEMKVNAGTCEIDDIESAVFVNIISAPGLQTATSKRFKEQPVAKYKGERRNQKNTTYRLRWESTTEGETSFRWIRSTR